MKKGLTLGLLAILVGGIFAAPSQAQWWGNRGFGFGWHRHAAAVPSDAISDFNNRLASVRARVNSELAQGRISTGMAARLNARLDSLSSQENAYASTGGGISAAELSRLNARLQNIRVSLGGWRYY